ncbi:hypothetical protein ID866_10792, partial [Astraeus odoratus]
GISLGLRYLHDHTLGPIVHGNLNGVYGKAVLSDFGLSRFFNSSLNISHPSSIPEQHHAGSALNWMAPEILDTGEVSTEADVWAFGMTVLELFTRTNPYDHISKSTLKTRIIEGPPDRPSPEDTCSRMTEGWWNISSSCWESDPKLRPSTSSLVENIEGASDAGQRFRNTIRSVIMLRRTTRPAYIEKMKKLVPAQELAAHQALVRHMQFSPNGKYLATSRFVFQCMPMPFTYIHPAVGTGPLSYSRLG